MKIDFEREWALAFPPRNTAAPESDSSHLPPISSSLGEPEAAVEAEAAFPRFLNEAVPFAMARSAVSWALDDRTADISEIKVVSLEPLRLELAALSRVRAYVSGAHGAAQMEHLRAWAFRGFQHLLPLLHPARLQFRLLSRSRSLLGSFRGDDQDGERLIALRCFLRDQGKQAASRDGVIGLHAFFNGDLSCSAEPMPDRPASCAVVIKSQRRRPL